MLLSGCRLSSHFCYCARPALIRSEPAVTSAVTRIEESLRWSNHPHWDLRAPESGGNGFFEGEEEPCINGGALALGAYFGHPAESLARRLLGEQLEDGGWNCEAPKSKVSSFHTTICVLEGLLEYERAVGPAAEVAAARRRGEEYLLKRSLFRRLSTGEVTSQRAVPGVSISASLPLRHSSCPRLLQNCWRAA